MTRDFLTLFVVLQPKLRTMTINWIKKKIQTDTHTHIHDVMN